MGEIVPNVVTMLFGKVAVILFTFALMAWGVTLAFSGKILRYSLGLSFLTLNISFLLSLRGYGLSGVKSDVLLENGGFVGQFFTQNVWYSIFGKASAAAPLGILVLTLALILILSFGLRPRHFSFLVKGSRWMSSLARKKDVEDVEPVEATIVEPNRKKSKEFVEEPVATNRKGIYMDDNTVFLEPDEFKIKRKGVLAPFNGRKNWLDQDMSLESVSGMPGDEVVVDKDTFVKGAETMATAASEGSTAAGGEYDKNEDPEIRRLEEYLRQNIRKMNALEIVEVKEKISALRRAGDLIAWEKDRKGRMQVKGDVRRDGAAIEPTVPPQAASEEPAAPMTAPMAAPVAAGASPVTGRNTVLSKNILRKNDGAVAAEMAAEVAADEPAVENTKPAINAEDLLGGDGAATEFRSAPENEDDTFAPVVYGADDDEPQDNVEFQDKTLVPSGNSMAGARAASIPPREPTAYDEYKVPSISDILNDHEAQTADYTEDELNAIGKMLEEKLENFKVKGRVIGCETGPMITRFEVEPGPGVKVSRFTALQEDLAMPLRVSSVRILAPIPGKAAVGIEIPNRKFQTVFSKDVFESEKFAPTPEKIQVALGKDITGEAFTMDLAKAPHLLIAGQTGSGKSVCINALMASMLFSKTPDELRMILVDPKAVELKMYENIPHLLAPVITKPEIAIQALQWLCYEMDRRTEVLATAKVRNIGGFNAKFEAGELPDDIPDEDKGHRMPFIVVIIDEMADLMMVAGKEIEKSVARLAAKARAVGIHLVLATQRPSVKVITGIIKANLPTRISFKVASQIDARTVMDHAGAEKLLGRGDMLFKAVNDPDPVRVHGAFLSDEEAEKLADACSNQNVYYPQVESFDVSEGVDGDDDGEGGKQLGKLDPLLFDVACWAIEVSGLSTSAVQRHFSVGYSRAGKIVDQLYGLGVCGPSKGNSKPRAMLVGMDELMQMERSGTFR
ncbi:DNA translocase FtsK [Fibrobacter sp. UWEL]|uniref:DNA translocase FtsK n=1 Tax=Fibrobacter sp. UWEL TaxID=1896209 RepID=UPI001F304AFD|nr:DNA translocase FtsK [Fibrobacter sp. UWEL]